MEILNNIWTALSTQNEGLVNILLLPCSFIENLIIMHLFIYLLNITTLAKKKKLIYLFVTSIITYLTLIIVPAPYNSFINYMVLFISIYFIFRLSILKTTFAIILPTIISALVGTLILNPFVKVINVEYGTAQFIPIYRLSYNSITYVALLLIILIIKHKNLYFNIFDELDKKSRIILIINFFLGFIVLSIQAVTIAYYSNNLPIIITLLSFFSLLTFFIVSFYSLTRVIKLSLTTRKLENAEEYNKTLQILHDNIRTFKHDYDNTVAAIGGYVKTKDLSGLEQYYSQLEDECVKVNRLYMLNPNIINNPGIYSILTTKYNEAEELNIKMNITVLWDLSKINMKIYEFTKIFGILIDNAIDAAKESDEKIINVLFKDDEKNKMQYLKIENSYAEKDVDLDNIFEKGKTSKENHTGLGLWEIRKILKRNNNLNLHTTKDSKYFTQQFEIYN